MSDISVSNLFSNIASAPNNAGLLGTLAKLNITDVHNRVNLHLTIDKKLIENAIGICLQADGEATLAPLSPYGIWNHIWRDKLAQLEHMKLLDNGKVMVVQAPEKRYENFYKDIVGKEIPALIAAVAINDRCLIKKCLRDNYNLDQTDPVGRTALMYAAVGDDPSLVKLLLHHGADPYISCQQKKNMLIYAIIYSDLDMPIFILNQLKHTLMREFLTYFWDDEGLNALMWVFHARRGEEPLIRMLLAMQPDITQVASAHDGKTAIMFAALAGNAAHMKLLIDYAQTQKTAIFDQRDSHGGNAMTYALMSKDPDTIILLQNAGAALTAQSITCAAEKLAVAPGDKPEIAMLTADLLQKAFYDDIVMAVGTDNQELTLAIINNMKEQELAKFIFTNENIGVEFFFYMLKHVVEHKNSSFCPINNAILDVGLARQNDQGLTILHYAIKRPLGKKSYDWLLAKGFSSLRIANYNRLPKLLHYAVDMDSISAVSALLSFNSAAHSQHLLKEKNHEGYTALTLAAKHGNVEMVNFLLNANAYSTSNIDNDSKSPAMHAAENSYTKALCALINYRIKQQPDQVSEILSETDNQGLDIMMYAAKGGNSNIIRWLHKKGASLSGIAVGDNGYTPLFYAVNYGRLRAVTVLLELDDNLHATTDALGRTPLMLAASLDHEVIVKRLLDAGADTSAENPSDDNKKAWHYAHDKANLSIMTLLKNHFFSSRKGNRQSLHN